MNLQTKMPTMADEFLRWNEGREGKREFVKGRVVELTIDVKRNHADIAANLILLMRGQLDRRKFSVGSADFAVRTPDGIRFPDVYVDRKAPEARGTDLAAVEPVILVEVLSPSSLARDFHDKWNDSRGISSLVHYLVISHEEARVWLTTRGGETWSARESFVGLEEIVFLPDFAISLPLADIYDGVELTSRQ